MGYEFIKSKLERRDVIILDGGTGTDIQRRGAPMSGDTWCADVNGTHLSIVQAVHEDYIDCGADIITANTFATSALSFNCYGRDDDLIRLDKLAVSAARTAARGKDVAVAGSVSTMRPVIRGSDRTDLSFNWTRDEAKNLFKRKIDNLVSCGVDMLFMEMMRDSDYSLWACETALDAGLPVWIGIAVEKREDGIISGFGRSDQVLDDFAPALASLQPDAMCIMHTSPDITAEAAAILKRSWHGPTGAYPESGYFKSPDWVFTDITPADLTSYCNTWQGDGLTIFGGCCGIGPTHIRALSQEFKS